MTVNIAVFASGSGSNAENLIEFFKNDKNIDVTTIFCNSPKAYVLERAKKLGVSCVLFDRETFQSENFLKTLTDHKIDFIVLAGFLWKLPVYLVRAFHDRIINIHPALLPKYGGKGMYGAFVHESVIANCEKSSGITIHLVNENYDEGRILFQKECPVTPQDTPASLAEKIHELEYQYFPEIVTEYIQKMA